jgi:hypothetical protein
VVEFSVQKWLIILEKTYRVLDIRCIYIYKCREISNQNKDNGISGIYQEYLKFLFSMSVISANS